MKSGDNSTWADINSTTEEDLHRIYTLRGLGYDPYDFLIERERHGEIRDLRLQVDFTLQEAYTDAEGRRVRAIRYRADFTYYEGTQGRQVVEDVKSRPTRTREYAMKKKMLKDRFGIDITEV